MSKSNFWKILIATLSICLILCAVAGVTAFAAEDDNAEVASEITPEIWAKNVAYGSKTYLYYAVPVDSIPAADNIDGGFWMTVSDADGKLAFNQYPEAETEVVNGRECYIFITRGVPAKELNTRELVQVVCASGAKSEVESYSVEDYLYTKLYVEGFAAKTADDVGDDGKDYLRRTLYYDLLKYGAIAQELLASDATDKIGDSAYASAPEAVATLGKLDAGTKVVLKYDATIETDEAFRAWEYAHYDAFGELIASGYAGDGSAFNVDGYLTATPLYGAKHNYITFDDGNASDYVKTTIANQQGDLIFATSGVIDGRWSVTKSMNFTEYRNAIIAWNEANPDNTLTVPDEKTGSIAANINIYANTKVDNANVVEFVADFSYEALTSLEYIHLYTTAGDTLYRAYMPNTSSSPGGSLKIHYEYGVVDGANNKAITVGLTTPIKTDGTTYQLKIRYISGPAGEARIEFYCNDALFHTTQTFRYQKYMTTPPKATAISHINFTMSNAPKGTMTFDNVAMTQVYDEHVGLEVDVLGADDAVIDFDGKASGYTPSVTAPNTYEVVTDPVTGDSYIEFSKEAKKSGASIRANVTEVQENANVAVIEYDFYIASGATVDVQVTIGYNGNDNSGNPRNNTTPFLMTPKVPNRNEWVNVRIEYRVLEMTDGKVTKVRTDLYINGELIESPTYRNAPDATTGIYKAGSTALEIFGGKYPVPKVTDFKTVTLAHNESCGGTFRYDNISYRLIHVEGCDPVVVSSAS